MNQAMTPEQLLIVTTAQLRRANPEVWNDFWNAFQNVAGQHLHTMATASVDVLPVAQGRAQNFLYLVKLFEESLVTSDKILENRKK